MHEGNQLYTRISESTGQTFLLQTELPSEINMLGINYEHQYSESYSSNITGNADIEGYQYCVPMNTAFESLISENYTLFMAFIALTMKDLKYLILIQEMFMVTAILKEAVYY